MQQEANSRPRTAHAPRKGLGDLRQCVVHVASSRSSGKLGENRVRVGRNAVHESVGQALEPGPHRLDEHDDDGIES